MPACRPSALVPALLCLCSAAQALDVPAVGPRALAMGGTGVAAARDHTAQFYNPALFGFFGLESGGGDKDRSDNQGLGRRDWGLGLDLAVGARINGDLATYVNDITGIDTDRLTQIGAIPTAQDQTVILDAIRALNSLANLDITRDAVTIDLNGGVGLQVGHFAIGVRGLSQASARILYLDRTNIGVDVGAALGANLANVVVPGFTPAGNLAAAQAVTPSVLTTAQRDQMADQMLALGLATSALEAYNAANQFDQAAQNGGYTAATIDPAFGLLVGDGSAANPGLLGATQSFAGGNVAASIANNLTTVRIAGVGVVEIPITYGWAFDQHLSIGASLKPMIGRVYVTDVVVFRDSQELDDLIRDARHDYKQSFGVGIDLGLAFRIPMLQIGVSARNLNEPKFKSPTGDDVRLKPTAKAGLAFIPAENFTLAADADLAISSTTLPSYETQRIAAGFEWELINEQFRVLALRGGVSRNLKDEDVGNVFHAGVGLDLYALRLDVGAAVSRKKIIYDGEEYPQEARVAFALATEW